MPLAHDPFSSIIRVSWNAHNHFVAGDASSDLYTSPDGIAWTALGRMGYGATGTGSASRGAYANSEALWYFGRSGVSPLASYSADGGQTWALSRNNPYAPTAGTLTFLYDIDAQQMYADQYRIDNSELYLLENFHVSGGTGYAPAPAWLQKKIRTGIATAPFVRMVAPSRQFDLENGNYVLYSPYLEISLDNETWVTVDPGLAEFPGTGPFDIAAGKGVLVAAGHKGIAATLDGVTWSLVQAIPPSPVEPGEDVSPSEYVEYGVRSVAFAGRFVATPEWGGTPRVYLSLDGIAWSTVATGMSSSFEKRVVGTAGGMIPGIVAGAGSAAAGLPAGEFALAAASGAFVLAGQDAAFAWPARALEAAAGAFTLTGQDAAMAVAGVYATFNGTTSNVTLSNGNLTVTHSNTTANAGARSTALKSSGKYYFEVTATDLDGAFDALGILTSAGTLTNLVTNGSNCGVVYRASGAIWTNGISSSMAIGAIADADVIGVAVDLDNERIWFRKAPSGNWNGSGTADPATNTGGASLSNFSGTTMGPAVGFGGTGTAAGDNFTGNFGASAFTGSVPSGFTSGWPNQDGSDPMAIFNKFNSFVEAVAEKKHDLGADTLKVALTNTAPVAANTVLADITQVANGNGYTTGGNAAAAVTSAQTAGTYKLVRGDVVFTATGAVGPFRYAVLYNDTAANDELIGWWDYGSSISLANGETFTVDLDATNGVLTLA